MLVDAIYEPPQSATATSLQLERGTEEEQRADYLAKLLGCGPAVVCCRQQQSAPVSTMLSLHDIQYPDVHICRLAAGLETAPRC